MRTPVLIAVVVAATTQLVSRPALAAHPRLHASALAARAGGGHQGREFSWGTAGLGAVELSLSPETGVQAELGALWLSQGNDPEDPGLRSQGAGRAFSAAGGIRLRPLASMQPGPGGLWLAGAFGGATTGGVVRPMFDAHLGYDFEVSDHVALGPTAGYLQVLQPDDQLRPADAHVFLIGAHIVWDAQGRRGAAGVGDRDHDGFKDNVDACPDDPEDKDGFQDDDGCPDLDNDNDGIVDLKDQCPNDPEDKDGFEDIDGCPDPDNDKDAIADVRDKCPNDPEDKDGFEDEDGCPDLDNDQDGIADLTDQCPLEPETKNGYADEDGCPDEHQVRVVGDRIMLDDRVHFRTNSDIIRPVSHGLLNRLAKLIKEHPEYVHIDIEGHADERGPDAFNRQLSERRAKAVMEFLVTAGVATERLSAQGYGEAKPLVEKSSDRAWFLNRRVEFRVTREQKLAATASDREPAPAAQENDK